ncbi:MAG: DNA-binding protein [Thermodesulfobacteriota bacterium]
MKGRLGLVIMGCLVLLATSSRAQPGGGPGGRGGGMHYGTVWDASSVTTVAGEVTAVEKFTPGRGGSSYGLMVTIKTDKESLPIILGPAWYVEQQHFAIASKDKLEVTGARMAIQGQATIIAAEVKKGGQILKLRDDKGIPLWAGPI